ncbi:hypothetical protein RHGRI_020811 [Rhododendron griersonianum]|uniref:Uncharacterized protein n=1 Tax=Rhododendron griersonianum TaxID=479676 RepID=A0AAV6JHR8_9ERIC|nr:hypothetical protein RHGRI_020811 [Rhododendron griersonianum]
MSERRLEVGVMVADRILILRKRHHISKFTRRTRLPSVLNPQIGSQCLVPSSSLKTLGILFLSGCHEPSKTIGLLAEGLPGCVAVEEHEQPLGRKRRKGCKGSWQRNKKKYTEEEDKKRGDCDKGEVFADKSTFHGKESDYLGRSWIALPKDAKATDDHRYEKNIKYWDTETGQVISAFSTGKILYVVRLNPNEDKQNILMVGMSDNKIV